LLPLIWILFHVNSQSVSSVISPDEITPFIIIILTGDFNLPDIEWDKEENRTKASPNYSKEINETIINLVNEHNLQQCKNMPGLR
jgi:hypothetical protein